ncbi:hypothetical protein PMY12_08770 [Clostridium tertium]|uniref:hypothetical protein n=1 Tax=Clostridium tertium TaxID=1559 RepID=UPI002330BE37|nr:hypothetical protein [Clostridium tertium]MDB1937105.1 hypothetical protein [Clostridium tertium]
MIFKYKYKDDYNGIHSFKNNQECGYYDNKTMDIKYPNSGFRIVGDLSKIKKDEYNCNTMMLDEVEHSITKYKRNLSIFNTVKGYIECENDKEISYVRIIKKSIWAFLIPLLLVIIFIAGIYMYQLNINKIPVDKSAVTYNFPDGVENKSDGEIMTPGYGDLAMKADTDIIKVNLKNIPGNPCYFKYIIEMADTNEVIYESDMIEPGKAVSEVKLNKVMKEGTYPIRIWVHSYDLQDYRVELNKSKFDVNLKVLK